LRRLYQIILVFFLAQPTTALAHGALAVAETSAGFVAHFSFNDATQDEARREALGACQAATNQRCTLYTTFANTCMGFARFYPGQYFARFSTDPQDAKELAYGACRESYANQ
jgi:hypothetical protein